ncbi:Diphthamide biosynthesis protein 4 [Ascochyta rabiei]|uniref:Diphthamide biosynthesis protein 4 n=1 Tax=Didymella rabiei TaxID=5454 RepID=A0A163DCS3_DIDRA|nr:Diphthamide biosynthesis protein 4 [Ascochyta rabiei]KZM23077.1 hypothetical protein ST47_g5699 [Ascochyta rabiei]UPX18023.1 Diphthamide biosynthesis protein 4 [Ascochyta rabiei]
MAYTKDYYHILGLRAPSPGSLSNRHPAAELRRAYRNALLAAHPDKKTATSKGSHSVDDVREAFRILQSAASRAQYDNWLLRNPHVLATESQGGDDGAGVHTSSQDFLLGLELLDLSDFEEHEVADEAEWTRACRCGDDKGFRIREDDLVDAEQRGEKEVLVGCGGCSLWVRVAFDVEEG